MPLPGAGWDTLVTPVQGGEKEAGSVGAKAGEGDADCCPPASWKETWVRGDLLRGHWGYPQGFVPPFALFLLCTKLSSSCLSTFRDVDGDSRGGALPHASVSPVVTGGHGGKHGGGQESLREDMGATSS